MVYKQKGTTDLRVGVIIRRHFCFVNVGKIQTANIVTNLHKTTRIALLLVSVSCENLNCTIDFVQWKFKCTLQILLGMS